MKNILASILLLSSCYSPTNNTAYEVQTEIVQPKNIITTDTTVSAEVIYRSTDNGETFGVRLNITANGFGTIGEAEGG